MIDPLLAGDPGAWRRVSCLVETYLACGNAQDLRTDWPDITQEVLISVLEGLRKGSLRDRRAFLGYVRAIAHHKLIDRLRGHMRRKQDLSVDTQEEAAPRDVVTALPTLPLEVTMDVRKAVHRLPVHRRRAIRAKYEEGQTNGEFAQQAGVSMRTVKRHLHDGLAELRRDLSPHDESCRAD